MYKFKQPRKTSMVGIPITEGETIEQKVKRITVNKEAIKDGATEIFTERKDGVKAGYDIRTDRWEVAVEATDAIHKSIDASRDHKAKMEVVKDDNKEKPEGKINGVEPTQGTSD